MKSAKLKLALAAFLMLAIVGGDLIAYLGQ